MLGIPFCTWIAAPQCVVAESDAQKQRNARETGDSVDRDTKCRTWCNNAFWWVTHRRIIPDRGQPEQAILGTRGADHTDAKASFSPRPDAGGWILSGESCNSATLSEDL
jgi:hypothetical protein